MARSHRLTVFQDRADAARQLAARLQAYRGQHPLVLAIPRGAVPMAKTVAAALQGDFDVVLVRKLRAPQQPELALGAVAESGWTSLSAYADCVSAEDLATEKERQMDILRQRRAQYTPLRAPIDPSGRTVIVVDDGLATGSTMVAALHSLRQQHPAQLVCAVPVSSPEALKKVRALADAVLCLQAPKDFRAVGQFYRDFSQVEDEDVMALLAD